METLMTLCAILNILALIVLGAKFAVKRYFPGVADFMSEDTSRKLDELTFKVLGDKK